MNIHSCAPITTIVLELVFSQLLCLLPTLVRRFYFCQLFTPANRQLTLSIHGLFSGGCLSLAYGNGITLYSLLVSKLTFCCPAPPPGAILEREPWSPLLTSFRNHSCFLNLLSSSGAFKNYLFVFLMGGYG